METKGVFVGWFFYMIIEHGGCGFNGAGKFRAVQDGGGHCVGEAGWRVKLT